MGRRQKDEDESEESLPFAGTPLEREQQLTLLANDLAERQMRAGTASAATMGHFLKAGSSREKLEQERLRFENELTQVKKRALEKAEEREVEFKAVLKAMGIYSGKTAADEEEGDAYEDVY